MTSNWSAKQKPNFCLMTKELKEFICKKKVETKKIQNLEYYPKISIITPSYNQAEFLEKTILSIINQNYPNLEYIIIDGGSTDKSVDIIKKYKKHITYWISEKDRGQAQAINKGLRLATGDFVGFQNSDDIYLPGAFEAFRKAMQNKKADLYYSHMIRIDKNDNTYDVQINSPQPNWMQPTNLNIHNQASLWNKKLVEKIGLINENMQFSLDLEYFLRILNSKAKICLIDSYIAAFRSHNQTKTAKIWNVQLKESRQIIKRHGSWIQRNIPRNLIKIIAKINKTAWCLSNKKVWYITRKQGLFSTHCTSKHKNN